MYTLAPLHTINTYYDHHGVYSFSALMVGILVLSFFIDDDFKNHVKQVGIAIFIAGYASFTPGTITEFKNE